MIRELRVACGDVACCAVGNSERHVSKLRGNDPLRPIMILSGQ